MELLNSRHALSFSVAFSLKTALLLRSGKNDQVNDNTIDKTPDGLNLFISGRVWASLIRRALSRLANGQELAKQVGKYDESNGISPLWCASSLVPIVELDARPGIVIDRDWGAQKIGLLFSEEIVPPGTTVYLNFVWFIDSALSSLEEEKRKLKRILAEALWVIDQGIENIGGGWSYGFGRLEKKEAKLQEVDLTKEEDRKKLFALRSPNGQIRILSHRLPLPEHLPVVAQPWKKITISFKNTPGQLLAIHTEHPLPESIKALNYLPDSFVMQGYRLVGNELCPEVIIPGKAIRQALFSIEIERRLQTEGKNVCTPYSHVDECCPDKGRTCQRCNWFGNTAQSGIIAVLDAPLPKGTEQLQTIHRVQLCEHSAQNMNLFSGQYLTNVKFKSEILLDCSRPETDWEGLQQNLNHILEEMKPKKGPPGWHRMGATSTCTGQLTVTRVDEEVFGNA